jgi:hypothetical protein
VSGVRRGRQGVATGSIVRRSQLRPRRRPAGQCQACFDARLSFATWGKHCADCKGETAPPASTP